MRRYEDGMSGTMVGLHAPHIRVRYDVRPVGHANVPLSRKHRPRNVAYALSLAKKR